MENSKLEKDPRFKIAEREAWIGIGLVVFTLFGGLVLPMVWDQLQ